MNENPHDEPEFIELEVLRVASRHTLGASERLKVAKPCEFSNAKGNTRNVASLKEVGDIAEASAARFLEGLASHR